VLQVLVRCGGGKVEHKLCIERRCPLVLLLRSAYFSVYEQLNRLSTLALLQEQMVQRVRWAGKAEREEVSIIARVPEVPSSSAAP
jgi:hypothetical protein